MIHKIMVLGKIIPIKRFKKLNHQGTLGIYTDEEIHLRSKFTDEEQETNTLVHETIHAICERLGLQLDNTVEEVIANAVANVIAENFKLTPRSLEDS